MEEALAGPVSVPSVQQTDAGGENPRRSRAGYIVSWIEIVGVAVAYAATRRVTVVEKPSVPEILREELRTSDRH